MGEVSSHWHVHNVRGLVRLITLIVLNMFSTYIVFRKSLKIIDSLDFQMLSSQKSQKLFFLALGNGFSTVLCIRPESSYIPLRWIWHPSYTLYSQILNPNSSKFVQIPPNSSKLGPNVTLRFFVVKSVGNEFWKDNS